MISVSELNLRIKKTLTNSFTNISLFGEVYDFKPSKSHWYFYLKEKTSMIRVIVWLSKQNKDISNGEIINANGYIDFYEKNGIPSFIINDWVVVSKDGLLQKEINKWKDTYQSLFVPVNKCPVFLNKIIVITSSEGAALKDFMYVMKSHKFTGNITVLNCLVQGEKCVEDLCTQITLAETMKPQLVVITRGGGSLEDLINYSKPDVLEAINKLKNNKVFTISAVGHESDTMLCDLIADLRCPTPSLAAEFIISQNKKHIQELRNITDVCKEKIYYFRTEIKQLKQLFHNSFLNSQEFINIKNNCKDKIYNARIEITSVKKLFLSNLYLENLKKKFQEKINNEKHNIHNLLKTLQPTFIIKDLQNKVLTIDEISNNTTVTLHQGNKQILVHLLKN